MFQLPKNGPIIKKLQSSLVFIINTAQNTTQDMHAKGIEKNKWLIHILKWN